MDSFEKLAINMMQSGKFNYRFIHPKDRIDFFARTSRVLLDKEQYPNVRDFRVAEINDGNQRGIDAYMRMKKQHQPKGVKKFDSMVKCNSGRKYYFGFNYA